MLSYSHRVLDNEKRIFDKVNLVCLVPKFTKIQSPILCQKETRIPVIKTACVLLNFIKRTDGKFSILYIRDDSISSIPFLNNIQCNNTSGYELRDYLKLT